MIRIALPLLGGEGRGEGERDPTTVSRCARAAGQPGNALHYSYYNHDSSRLFANDSGERVFFLSQRGTSGERTEERGSPSIWCLLSLALSSTPSGGEGVVAASPRWVDSCPFVGELNPNSEANGDDSRKGAKAQRVLWSKPWTFCS